MTNHIASHRVDPAGDRQHVWPNTIAATVKTKIWVEVNGGFAIGEGGLDLLAAIAARRSLTKAAADVGWSYRHAWGYLRRAERALGVMLVQQVAGKGESRGMAPTDDGQRMLTALDHIRKAVSATARRQQVHVCGAFGQEGRTRC